MNNRAPQVAVIRAVKPRRPMTTARKSTEAKVEEVPGLAAIKGVLWNNPCTLFVVPENPGKATADRDENVHQILSIITANVSRPAEGASKELDAWSRQEWELAARIFATMAPMDLNNPDMTMESIQSEGLRTLDGGYLPPQDAIDFVFILMGMGPEEGKGDLQAIKDEIIDTYNASEVAVFYAVDPTAAPSDPVHFVPMVELPEVLIEKAFPGLLESTELRSWLSSKGGAQ